MSMTFYNQRRRRAAALKAAEEKAKAESVQEVESTVKPASRKTGARNDGRASKKS